MDENRIAYVKEQIEFLRAELNRKVELSHGEFQPEAAVRIEESRSEMRRKLLELMDRLADPQREERREQERQQYRALLERLSTDNAALKAAEDIAGQCDEDETRRAIFSDVAMAYESTKSSIAKLILEKLA